ncbi:phosphoglycerate dehydrogenase-like oxidoreductase [Halogeometricum borinquense DSM 11551]|uniref:Phosphoglycerate dehydrogenase-like oxidoreductase n=2 Tax=Halogeometricum borinquense TaxID=60847 RepID=E4NRN6_HALBP|nr:D-2-hydroxyacid dehydrogenase [Halogeometricum borinquense]ADQ65712.1 phosphoglycerate dehydrogenase-like oxidoreductase [Halogeometricum borinquense DSM 11551]ELY27041.1 phosphoglycerate dehydrogenase-like oxidoreductase [Halogeometricum borinquense DSM 11551]RYJ15102.1 D-2-hydroxyacid dehydrogenase [Halogeometricum borinquense]
MTRILVLDDPAHGIPASEYADELRERLPETTVIHRETTEATVEAAADAAVITGIHLPDDVLEAAAELRLFAAASAGYDHLPLDRLRERGVTVTNASGVHGPNIAEHVIGWLLMLARSLDEGIRRQQRREWRQFQAFGELQGSTVTVVGLGAIGQAIGERLDPFGVETIGVRYTPEKGGPTDEVIGFDEIESALVQTDYLVLACPLTETTAGLIDADALKSLPTDAALVNVGRGGVVDTDALVRTIRRDRLRAAALDVTDPEPLPHDHPLWDFENVLLTPHVSGYTPQYWTRRADILARNIEHIFETGEWTGLENQISP